jgi:hypothetical protein
MVVPLESPWWVGVHWVYFPMFLPIVEKFWILSHFFTENSIKSKLKIIREFVEKNRKKKTKRRRKRRENERENRESDLPSPTILSNLRSLSTAGHGYQEVGLAIATVHASSLQQEWEEQSNPHPTFIRLVPSLSSGYIISNLRLLSRPTIQVRLFFVFFFFWNRFWRWEFFYKKFPYLVFGCELPKNCHRNDGWVWRFTVSPSQAEVCPEPWQ